MESVSEKVGKECLPALFLHFFPLDSAFRFTDVTEVWMTFGWNANQFYSLPPHLSLFLTYFENGNPGALDWIPSPPRLAGWLGPGLPHAKCTLNVAFQPVFLSNNTSDGHTIRRTECSLGKVLL